MKIVYILVDLNEFLKLILSDIMYFFWVFLSGEIDFFLSVWVYFLEEESELFLIEYVDKLVVLFWNKVD